MKEVSKKEVEMNKKMLASFGITKEIQNVFVTPEMAQAFLETSPGNRNVQQSRIDELVYYMQSGQWGGCESKITFDSNYCMNNGHSRCKAMIACGIGYKFTIELNFENHEYIDNGNSRGFVDNQNMLPSNNPNKVNVNIANGKIKSIINTILYHNKMNTQKVFQCDTRKFAKQYEQELIDFLPVLRFKGFKIGVYAGLFAAHINGVPIHDLIEYSSILVDCLDRTPRGRHRAPIVAWRDKVNNYTKGGGQAITNEMYLRTQYSLYKYLSNSDKKRSCAIEKYPLDLTFLNDQYRAIYR